MHETRKSQRPVKPGKPIYEKPEAWKEYLKAMVMRSYPYNPEDLNSVVREKANKKSKNNENGVPAMSKQNTSTIPNSNTINENAKKFAINLMKSNDREKSGKIRRMEAVINRADNSESVHVQLCRFFPKAKKPTQGVIKEMVGILEKWNLKSFKEMFHMMRIYYEAQDAGFNMEEKKNDGQL